MPAVLHLCPETFALIQNSMRSGNCGNCYYNNWKNLALNLDRNHNEVVAALNSTMTTHLAKLHLQLLCHFLDQVEASLPLCRLKIASCSLAAMVGHCMLRRLSVSTAMLGMLIASPLKMDDGMLRMDDGMLKMDAHWSLCLYYVALLATLEED